MGTTATRRRQNLHRRRGGGGGGGGGGAHDGAQSAHNSASGFPQLHASGRERPELARGVPQTLAAARRHSSAHMGGTARRERCRGHHGR